MREAANSPHYSIPVDGFTHTVRVAGGSDLIFVSGITARGSDGALVSPGDVAGQARRVLTNLSVILQDVGASLDDVVRTATFLTNMDDHSAVHAVRREFFGDAPPTSTTVEVSRLYDPEQLIEMEAVAAVTVRPQF